jgi:serine/threonine protein kinase
MPFGRYRLVELLGRGGMGEVWRAYDTETKRIVAIKVLPPYLADDNEFVRRFRREAEAAAQLNSPHVVPIHNYGEIGGRLYVDMRLIAGRDLGTVLADGPLEPARAVRIIDQVARALHAAHKVGLLHRDIKPSNILLDDDDFAYLIDFGIARAADDTRMTKSGHTIGTFQYIAPERLDPQKEEDARADVYSLACVLYESLTGEPPFAGCTTPELMWAHVNTLPPRPSTNQPDVPPQVDEVIATGMAKDPDNRYATTVEFADAARDAITVPIPRPSPAPKPATEPASLVDQSSHGFHQQPTQLAPTAPVPPPKSQDATTASSAMSRGAFACVLGGTAWLSMAVVFCLINVNYTFRGWSVYRAAERAERVLDYIVLAGVFPGIMLVARGRARSSSGQIIAGCALIGLATSTLVFSVMSHYRDDVKPLTIPFAFLSLAAIPIGLPLILIPMSRRGPTRATARGYLLSGGAIVTLAGFRLIGMLSEWRGVVGDLIGGFIGLVLVLAAVVADRRLRR